MPIEAKIRDNTSGPIDIKIHDTGTAHIKTKSDYVRGDIRLENLINKETAERKEADSNLEASKQDRIKLIEITEASGVFDENQLAVLTSGIMNKIVYNNTVYSLAVKESDIYRFFSRSIASEINEITVDVSSGTYVGGSRLDPRLEAHINDTVVHITADERLKWNDKVSAEINEEDLKLIKG